MMRSGFFTGEELLKTGSLRRRPNESQLRRFRVFDVPIVIGNLCDLAVGHVGTAMIRNIFTMAVERLGTPLRRTASARLVHINGDGPLVCSAPDGRCTRIGMRKHPGRINSIHFEDMRRHRK
jgi:hypothetical protein